MPELHECWWCGLIPGAPNGSGHPAKQPHAWWRREIDGLLVSICGPCWQRRDLQAELERRRVASVVSAG
jgi:hypothetical protein